MPRNVEIKARVDDLAALQAKVEVIADSGPTAIAQDDTFFRCPNGRLKLRAFAADRGELIFYQRSDASGPKTSFYRRTPTTDPQGLREALTLAHGATGRVVKQRLLFLIGRTRVHLDLVDGLGSFVELEVVTSDDEAAEVGEAEAHRLLTMLGIASTQLVATAYVDLLAARVPAASASEEKGRMLAGDPYNANDPQLLADRDRARARWMAFNASPADDAPARRALLAELFGADFDPAIQPPFFCDYGFNIRIGANAFFNVNCVFLDVMPITIGKNALLGPNVQLYTALHPMTVAGRRGGLESARPITIGDDVWIGGNAVVCPGVTIGDGAVIGAGSVVTRDVPTRAFAAGNPCRVIRTIEDDEDLRRLMR